VDEILSFSKRITELFEDEKVLKRFLQISAEENVKEWNDALKEYKLEPFCFQLCRLLCAWQCKGKCYKICPPSPLITRIGSIPVSQIDSLGYGNGPSIPPFFVGSPNPAAGYGDHPFGGPVWLMGIFNMPTATEYRVEVASSPAGPYSPIIVGPQLGYDNNPAQPPPHLVLYRFRRRRSLFKECALNLEELILVGLRLMN